MTLIRHNVRTGSRQPYPMAHDTERPDRSGTVCAGRSDRVFTSAANPCPDCGGYGELQRIQPVSRSTYDKGSQVPERYRSRATDTLPKVETDEVDTWTPPVVDGTATVVPAAPTGAVDATSKALADLLASLVPDAAAVRAEIDAATADLRAQCASDSAEAMQAAIAALLVPTTVRVESPDREAVEITGAHEAFATCLRWLSTGRHLWLVGPAGCGKTTLAKHLADALGVKFYTTGQVLSEHQVTGFVDAGGTYHSTAFREAFEHGGLWLGDEMDSWSPEAALACNAALANGHATFPDSPAPIPAHADFYVVAAANTYGTGADREYVGRNEMDAATLDRFVTIPVDYDKALETALAAEFIEWRNLVWKVRANAAALKLRKVYGTRRIVFGVDWLAAGGSIQEATDTLLRGNLDDATWAKVSA